MTEQEFNELLKSIENGTFIGNELTITTRNFEEDVIEGSIDFNDDKVLSLVEAFKKNPCITKLDLYHNNIGVIGATALASIVSLELLNLGSNPIVYSKERHQQFLDMINTFIGNKTIITLNLNDCYILDGMIAQLIKNNSTIKNLTLSICLTDEALKFIEENKILEGLSIPSHEMADKGMEYILKNTSLKAFGIAQSSKITDVGVELLRTHPTIKTLYIGNDEIIMNNTQVGFIPQDQIIIEPDSDFYSQTFSQASNSINLSGENDHNSD